MSMPEPINPYDSPETVKPGMSGSTKVLLGVGIGCGVLALLCCGGLIIGGVFFGRSFSKAVSTEPDTIRAVTESIVSIEVPPPLKPVMSLDWTIPIVDRKMMTMAIYSDKEDDPENMLFLFQMSDEFVNRDMMKAQFEQQLQQSSNQEWKEIELEDPETIEIEINGSPAEFTFGRGKVRDSDREAWQAIGDFDGKGGPAMLIMQLNADDFTEEQARGILSSMK